MNNEEFTTVISMATLTAETTIPKVVGSIGEADLENYYTKDEADNKYATKEQIKDYPTKEYVDNAVANVQVDLTGYATEEYVNNAIAAIPETDLSNYYTKPEVDVLVENADKIYVGDTEPTDDSLIWISQNGLNEPVATENYVSETISSALGAIGVAEQEAF